MGTLRIRMSAGEASSSFVHEGNYVAEIDVELIDSETG